MTILARERAFQSWMADMAGLDVKAVMRDTVWERLKAIKGAAM